MDELANQLALSSILSSAFAVGLVAAFNPCGFAMLPAYLSYFVSLESSEEANIGRNIFRGLVVGLTLTVGFVLFFGTVGLLTSTIVSQGAIQSRLSWATFVIGILMVPLGIAMLFGYEPKLLVPRLNKGGTSRQLPSIFLFGVSFAVVSLGCTAPLFFATVVGSFESRNLWEGTLVFLAYAGGMSLIVMILTLATALGRNEIATSMRKVLPYVSKISGGFLVLAGGFLILYGWWEIQVMRGNFGSNWFVDTSQQFQTNITNWLADIGEARVAVAVAFILWAVVLRALWPMLDRRVAYLWLGLWIVAWALVEIWNYDWELFVLPIWRFVIDLPFRVADWFREPGRWAVLFEVLVAAVVALIVWGPSAPSKEAGGRAGYGAGCRGSRCQRGIRSRRGRCRRESLGRKPGLALGFAAIARGGWL